MISGRHKTARGCPKANSTGPSQRQNENFIIGAGSTTYPSTEGIRASPLLGAGYTTPLVSLNVLVQCPNSPVILRDVTIPPFQPFKGLRFRVGHVPSKSWLGL